MTIVDTAKNLLEDKTCDDCYHREYSSSLSFKCWRRTKTLKELSLSPCDLPEENTCETWKSQALWERDMEEEYKVKRKG